MECNYTSTNSTFLETLQADLGSHTTENDVLRLLDVSETLGKALGFNSVFGFRSDSINFW